MSVDKVTDSAPTTKIDDRGDSGMFHFVAILVRLEPRPGPYTMYN